MRGQVVDCHVPHSSDVGLVVFAWRGELPKCSSEAPMSFKNKNRESNCSAMRWKASSASKARLNQSDSTGFAFREAFGPCCRPTTSQPNDRSHTKTPPQQINIAQLAIKRQLAPTKTKCSLMFALKTLVGGGGGVGGIRRRE